MLGEIVTAAAARFGPAPAFVHWDGWRLSYADLDEISDEVAAGMAAHGVGEGDVVALLLPSAPDYAVAYVAAAKLGAITAGVNPRLAGPERAALLAVARPKLIVATRDLLDGTSTDEAVVVEPAGDVETLLTPLRTSVDRLPTLPRDPERPIAIVFTSGTTGRPKGAAFCERQLDHIARIDVAGWSGAPPTNAGLPMLASTQFAHVGFMTKLPWYLWSGSRIHLLDRWRAADAIEVIAREQMPNIGGVAPQLALMLRDPELERNDLSCVRSVVMGGAPSPPALVEAARRRLGAAYSVRYSSTESGGLATATAFDAPPEEALHTVGRARPGIRVEVRDPDDLQRRLPAGEVGEVWILSPTAMERYWDDEDATAQALHDGWLRTGDLGSLDGSGLLRLAGRSDDVYLRGGYNVHPEEVEAVLSAHPCVDEVAVVPGNDPVLGQVGVAVIVPCDGARAPELAELRRFAAGHLASHKLPESLLVLDALPLTPGQKLDRSALRTLVHR